MLGHTSRASPPCGRASYGSRRGVAAPAVERIVERHAGRELLEVVGIHARQAERRREQPRRFRREIEVAPCRRRARSSQAARAARSKPNSSTIMSKVHRSPRWLQNTAFDVEGRRGKARRRRPLATSAGNEQEHGVRIDEAADEPGQAMRSTFGRARVTQTVRPWRRAAAAYRRAASAALPRTKPRTRPQGLGREAFVPQPRSDPLTELPALSANGNSLLARVTSRPRCRIFRGSPDGAWDQPRIGGKILVGPHVDEDRTVRKSDEAGELWNSNDSRRRHARPPFALSEGCWTRTLGWRLDGDVAGTPWPERFAQRARAVNGAS